MEKYEYYIQYKDYDGTWVFFSDKNFKVYKFNSKSHAQNQIDYFLNTEGNVIDAFTLEKDTETRVIKAIAVY